ncbi:hypothetical protein GH714_020811 [Hevea brasiliensis]|uniref:PORR domain-containing protein n=1 Tax=Hevea brasiliensis TaxID=3981 RepID=A0A6A6N5X2_HEVBR|nr:hypothetical protein GH714_020811 [Hevea brasiliensis]
MAHGDMTNVKKGERIGFSLSYPNGFDLKKKVKDWVFEWQGLPYISPYENAFHLNPNGDQAEKWVVAVLHELLWLLVSKKTEKENVLILGDYLGFGNREAYRKDFLVIKHPLMGMRFRYIHLMNKAIEKPRKAAGGALRSWSKRRAASSINKGEERTVRDKSWKREEDKSSSSSDSEFEDLDYSASEVEDASNDEANEIGFVN